jgi:hypothetical protein
MKKKCPFFVFILCSMQLFAQEKDSILAIIANDYAPEKMFIHFDKSIYNKAETIWFKAYLYDGNFPSTTSKNFYADWYNDAGNLIQHDVFPIVQSSTNGQFIVPDNYKGKSLHIKAYTTWMLNFDTAFLYNKNIPIFQSNTSISLIKNVKPTLTFFAEGGNMINGIGSFVAFKATNQFLQPINIKGVIKNELNEIIDSIKTEYDGMGMVFIANPNTKNTYTAFWQDDITNMPHTTILPKVVEDGIALQVQNLSSKLLVNISRTNIATDDEKIVRIFCVKNNIKLYEARVKLLHTTNHSIEIDTKTFGTGIVQITVCNDNYLPMAERIAFINNNDYQFNATINTPLKNINKRGKNTIEISVADTLLSNMSLAITDATNTISDSVNNIFSHLLLSTDIKGYVHNPAYYFAHINNEIVQQHLDLVMLTNGWRKYNWQKILNNKTPIIRYPKDTTYLNIIGTTYGITSSNLLPQQEIFLFTETADSIRKQHILPVNKKGIFSKNNFIFYGRLKLHYSFLTNKKLNQDAEVVFNNGLFNTPTKNNFDTLLNSALNIDYAYYEKMKKYDEEYKRLSKIKGSGVLDEVVVQTRKKDPIEALDKQYATSLFAGGDAYKFDVMNDLRGQSSTDVLQYLTGMVPGLQIRTNGGETTVKWREGETEFFIDEMRTEVDAVSTISMSEIAYIKVFRPPFFGGLARASGGAIAIYTRKGGDVKSTPGKGLPFKHLEGYTVAKQFYAPNYEKETVPVDVRTTLYWQPYIFTNKHNQSTTISFFNNDVCKKIKIVLCGINDDGKMVFIEKIVE